MLNDNEKNMRTISYVVYFLANAVGMLIMYFVLNTPQYSDELKSESKHLLNSAISFAIYYFAAALLCIILIGLIALPILCILQYVFIIIGFIKSLNNEPYRIPLTIEFVK